MTAHTPLEGLTNQRRDATDTATRRGHPRDD